jgi:hypothetical protein
MIGVLTDAETVPWTTTQRNTAISEGYADLWRAGVWKDALQDLATGTDTWSYPLTSIRHLTRLELLDSSGHIFEQPRGIIEPDGTGTSAFHLRLRSPIDSGYTLRVRGWAPYVSTFASDAATDDLPAEQNRIPLIKAQAILYRGQLAKFARYGEVQVVAGPMNVSVDALIGLIAASEREYAEATREIRAQRTRTSINGRL